MTTYESIFHVIAVVCYIVAAFGGVALVTRRELFSRQAVLLLALAGFICQATALGIRCATTTHPLFSSLYEILALTACSLVLLFLVVSLRLRHAGVAAFCLPLVAGLALAALFMPSSPREIFPSAVIAAMERRPIFVVHVLAALLGYAAFLLVATAGAMYLVQARELKAKLFGRLFEALPSLETLERLARGATLAGVILFALSLALGATMAEGSGALGSRWLLRPKIFLALLTLAAFAALAVAQRVGTLRGRRAAVLAIIAFFLVVLTMVLGHVAV